MAMLVAILTAVIKDFKPEDSKLPNIQLPKMKTFLEMCMLPFQTVYVAKALAYSFQKNPFRVPDSKKQWYQYYAKSDVIPIQTIKNIKNEFGVGFTSVTLSAMGAGIAKAIKKYNLKWNRDTMPCGAVLPIPGGNRLLKKLTNYVTAGIVDLPVVPEMDSLERLKAVHELLQNVRLTVPLVVYVASILRGYQPWWLNCRTDNNVVGVGLTNVAGTPEHINRGDATCDHTFAVAGCLGGEAGLGFTVFTHVNDVRFHVAVENAIMTREQANQLVQFVYEEIKSLEAKLLLKKSLKCDSLIS